MEKKKQSIVEQIANVLIINGGFLDNPGLYNGEMGLVLFFARYARHTRNDLYMAYCSELIEKIQQIVHQDTPINYTQGLTGIGSAIEYLVQNQYFEVDTDEILEDFDKRIFFTFNLAYLPVDLTIDVLRYVNWRLSGNSTQKDKIRRYVLPQIEKVLARNQNSDYDVPDQFSNSIMPAGFEDKTMNHCLELISTNQFWNMDLGLYDGLAGWGMALMTELDNDNSWFSLFSY